MSHSSSTLPNTRMSITTTSVLRARSALGDGIYVEFEDGPRVIDGIESGVLKDSRIR